MTSENRRIGESELWWLECDIGESELWWLECDIGESEFRRIGESDFRRIGLSENGRMGLSEILNTDEMRFFLSFMLGCDQGLRMDLEKASICMI